VTWTVPLTAIELGEPDIEAVLDCLESGWLTMGPRTAEFEEAAADYLGARHVLAVSSGTSALHLALLAAGVGPSDEVIVPGLTFVASVSTVRFVGADPVMCEVRGPEDLNVDPEDVAARITPRTKAVVAVHFAGYSADMAALGGLCAAHDLVLVEDACQAMGGHDASGRRAGTVGTAGCFSLFSKSQLFVGEGGLVATDDDALADRVRSLRSHAMTSVTWDRHLGHAESYDVTGIGFNYRMDEPRAALGLSRLAHLDDEITGRRRLAARYRDRLDGLDGLIVPWDAEAAERSGHYQFPVVLPDRDARDDFRITLRDHGVQTTWYPAVHRFSEMREHFPGVSLPRVDDAADRHCMLPLHASLTDAEVETILGAIEEAVA
jgi:dTDP-4-amino-4,6-dideoxygalactose transaminase